MSAPPRTPPAVFEQLYRASEDPWSYASRAEESAKYRRSIALLDGRRYTRALELGCSIGVFTRMLASECDAVVALDPSRTAIARARERLRGCSNVEFCHGAAPEGLPQGQFDLIVCSEVLVYLGRRILVETLAELERRLAPGGTLLAVHFRRAPRLVSIKAALISRLGGRRGSSRLEPGGGVGWRLLGLASLRGVGSCPTPYAPLSGDEVHELLRAHTRLVLTCQDSDDQHRLERFDDCR